MDADVALFKEWHNCLLLRQGEGPPGSSEHGETLRKRNLESVYDRFTEAFDIADLKAAKALLDTLMQPNKRISSSFRDACKYLIPSGSPDTGAAQGALPVGGHRVERLLCGFLALQSF